MAAATGSVTFMKKGRFYEEFTPGRVFTHHWGRTIHQSDNLLFCTMLMHFNPMYFNLEFARAHGHPSEVVNPYLAFNVVFGLSVEDLSEAGGFFLGMKDLVFKQPVYAGDTLTATSTVLERRESSTKPGMGIATWHTEGFNQHGACVLSYQRSNFVRKRESVS
jgi:acyl dehydratase